MRGTYRNLISCTHEIVRCVVSYAPARIDMVKSSSVSEVGSIDGKLVVSVELGFHCVVAGPWITTTALQHEHAVVDRRAVERTECIDLRRRCVYRVCQQ
jgi:hypothetical protein